MRSCYSYLVLYSQLMSLEVWCVVSVALNLPLRPTTTSVYGNYKHLCSAHNCLYGIYKHPCSARNVLFRITHKAAGMLLKDLESSFRHMLLYRCRGHGVHGTSPDSEDRVRDRHYANGHW